MPYIHLRFITEQDFVSDAIRFVTHAPNRAPSHVEFGLDNDTHFLGAHIDGGVKLREAGYDNPSWERRYAIPCTQQQYDIWHAFVMAQVGKPYDTVDIASILLDKDWHNKDKWICSELVVAALEVAGIFLLNVLPQFTSRIDPDKAHLSPLLIGHSYFAKG